MEPRAKTRPAKPTPPAGGLGAVLEFMSLLWAIDHGLESLSKRLDAAFGVTGGQRLAVRIIGRKPGIGAGELAATMRLHPSTLTGVLQRLVERGMIERAKDPTDARRVVLALTPGGRLIDTLRTGTVEAAVARMLKGFSAAEIRTTSALLEATARELEREAQVTPRPR